MKNRVIVFGATGFVGSHIMACLGRACIDGLGVSRSGSMPISWQKNPQPWMDRLSWVSSDASVLDESLFNGASSVISCIGSPPVPTFSEAAFKKQLQANGDINVNIIRSASINNIERIILIGAQIPAILQTEKFAYYLGKQKALEAARQFALSEEGRFAAVLQPGGIYGTRSTQGGVPIPLNWLMHPVSVVHQALPEWAQKRLPAQFVSVHKVASMAVDQLSTAITDKPFKLISNEDIQGHSP